MVETKTPAGVARLEEDSMTAESHRPTVHDVDPNVMAVDSLPDEVRLHGDADETSSAQLGDGSIAPVDVDEQRVELTPESDEGAAGSDASTR
jgi:hypothetical protein